MWDERYARDEFVYGEEPNGFLKEQAHRLAGPVLSLAEGEGRNAVFLAQQGLAVTGVDSSAVGLAKAQKLAAARGVQIDTQQADLAQWSPAVGQYGAVVSIFAHLPSVVRLGLYPKLMAALQPGGHLVLEAYRPEQLHYGTGGPRDADLMPTLTELQAAFAGFEVLHAQATERDVIEGALHTGRAAVVQFVACKPVRTGRSTASASERALQIAQTMLAGFNRHYALFRYSAQLAKGRFEAGDWHAIQALARTRITFYDQRVQEAVQLLEDQFWAEDLQDAIWARVKRHYVQLLAGHEQPELAETFFNTVSTKILHRTYFHNDYIFVRPAVSTDYLDAAQPSYRSYYPLRDGWGETLRRIMADMDLACPFQDIERDLARVREAGRRHAGEQPFAASDCQIHVLASLFLRNKAAYLIGRIIDDGEVEGFAVPILRDAQGRLYLDTVLFGTERIEALFNFSRAYFMVDMAVPSAWVRFLRTLMPTKPLSELYTMLGLHKQGKTLFYRDLLEHLAHSHDQFQIAPGIKGLVMGVFTLPSFPYVFKFIKDKRKKDVSREHIEDRYQLVKAHDRVGRMADSWEYSGVPFPRDRLAPELLQELRETAPSLLEEEEDRIVIRHLYIERRMVPLNLYLEGASDAERDHAVREYGQAIKEMVAANIFPGDMLYKNFGMTRQGRVVFYDYDEVVYLTECNFRRIPAPRTPEDEMASEPWYRIGPNDVFPEEFGTFLLGNPGIRQSFMKYHADLLEPTYWQEHKERIGQGQLEDVFPYPPALRFDPAQRA